MNEIVVLGAGRHGREIASYIRDLTASGADVELLGFVDDGKTQQDFPHFPILGTSSSLEDLSRSHSDLRYITATGENQLRQKFVEQVRLLLPDLQAWTLVHPRSVVGSLVTIGAGSCVAPGVVITTNVEIGEHCIINVGVSVSHDCKLGDLSNINPGAVICGDVIIGEGAYVGAGVVIKDKLSIGKWSVIGAGAAVVNDIPANVLAMGVPARVVRSIAPQDG